MTTIDLVILSSSPPKPRRHDAAFAHAMSLSPSRLPSPNTLIRQNRALRSGAPAPSAVALLSTSVGGLLGANNTARSKQNDSIWDFPEDEMSGTELAIPEPSKVKAASKPRAKKATAVKDDNGASEAPLKKPRKPRAKKTDEDAGPVGEPAVKQNAVRKPRAKKTDAEGQTKIPKGRITKSSTGSISKNDGKAGDTVSAHFAKFTNTEDYIDIDNITLDKGLNLQEAAKRRADWTPPKATDKGFSFGGALGEVVDLDTPPKVLTDLLGSFGYSKPEEQSTSIREVGMVTARKRKLIELVETNAMLASPQVAPTTKATKKRPTTITERATAAYARGNDDDMEPTPLLQYLSHKDTGSGSGTKSRARSPAKKPRGKKAAAPPPPDLLNPQAAHEQANRQEFVFGTSSQLAQDEDPEFLRDLQQAIQLSNRSEDPFAEDLSPTRNAATSGRRKSPKKRTSLWEAALRIEEEGATEVEILDLINSSQVERELQIDRAASIAAQTGDTLEAAPQPDLAAPVSLADRPSAPKEPPSQHANPVSSKPGNSTELSMGEQCPNFESYPTAELAKEIASYKFKPIKKREQMISLLKKCWEGKKRTALGSLGVNTIINKTADEATSSERTQRPSQMPPASPTKIGDRPRKDSGTTSPSSKRMPKPTARRPLLPHNSERLASDSETPTQYRQSPQQKVKRRKPLPEEISDSDTLLTPSPPRRRASRGHTPPSLSLVEDDIADITLPPLSPNSAEQELFEHITKAVTTAPRGTPQAPSWYEKMLMYDPIVLEDLTRWLNTEGLDGVGYDGEAKGEQVKTWCRARSVCCLWKISSRKGGGVKKLGRGS
ncbi:5'-flap endonuclease [Pseudogymnoascus destructans]|uniref:Structure-specific endonuclease subunit SLX4 n=2 Tax=Pseudogymnoascus destructans TaxID=655981 RepID=L8G4Y5_PSED2|nr:5'-flap endonuclease [Pseudogymnoascus destructans]ELR07889.1 hypothetical protein GMDG_02771 [Pseudogymnoascus destructans 20631-21]OAF58270.1 5'-flap endonuclease [Pseudogymnoascus destructans]